MAQESQNFAHRGRLCHIVPKGSTAIASGDYVAMARNTDPISRAVLGDESRISPTSTGYTCQWGVGICDSTFSANAVGAALYATPTSNEALPVIRQGVVRLAITQTSGKLGDLVILNSGTSGSQTFKLNNYRRDIAVGVIYEDFTGATANDPQQVELFEKPLTGRDIYFTLGNGVVQGCIVRKATANADASTQVNVGMSLEDNYFRLKNKMFTLARDSDHKVTIAAGGQSAVRFHWIAGKVSTTGRANAWTNETCTGPFSAFASFTDSGISMGMMIPITWTSNMVPLALLVGWSATQVTIGSDQILNLGPSNQIPWGIGFGDHETWYL